MDPYQVYSSYTLGEAILAFCVRNFPKSYYIKQILTMIHDCPVPVDKHKSAKKFPHGHDPLGDIKGQIKNNIR